MRFHRAYMCLPPPLVFSERAPKQPLVAVRSMEEMLSTAISRATTDDRFAESAGLDLSRLPREYPSLGAVVEAATRAARQVEYLLGDNVSVSWPIPEFEVSIEDGGKRLVHVVGAVRPLSGEIAVSGLWAGDLRADASAWLRRCVESSGGLPADWASPAPDRDARIMRLLLAATLPRVPQQVADTFSARVLEGRSALALGWDVSWARVGELESYLGQGVMTNDLRMRLAEALARGVMIRGALPDWRKLVRDAVMRRLRLEIGPLEAPPLLVHVVASSEPERRPREGPVPGLLQAESSILVSRSFWGVSRGAFGCCVARWSLGAKASPWVGDP